MNSSAFPFTFFLLYICLGMLTAYLATKKNRNPIGWFLAGMFFGIFAVIFLLILPPLSFTQDDDSSEREDSEDFFSTKYFRRLRDYFDSRYDQSSCDRYGEMVLFKQRSHKRRPAFDSTASSFFGGMQELAGKRNRP